MSHNKREYFGWTSPKFFEGLTEVNNLYEANFNSVQVLIEPPDYRTLFNARYNLSIRSSDVSYQLQQIDPVSFQFLNPAQQEEMRKQLLFIFGLTSYQYRLNAVEEKYQTLPHLGEQIKKSAILLACLDATSAPGGETDPESYLKLFSVTSERNAKYLGFLVGNSVKDKIEEIQKARSITDVILSWINGLNDHRLYWVWSGGMLETVLKSLPDTLAGEDYVKTGFQQSWQANGYLSWILYYARFAINSGLIFKHTFKGSPEERKISKWDRLKAHAQAVKYSLINDSVWGLANMVCFFWLTGVSLLRSMGLFLTAVLFLMDSLAIFTLYVEERKKHAKVEKNYAEDLLTLTKERKELEKFRNALLPSTNRDGLDLKLDQLNQEIEILTRNFKHYELDHFYHRFGLLNDVVYANAIFLSFAILLPVFIPGVALAPAVISLLTIISASLCFSFAIGNVAFRNSARVLKENNKTNEIEREKATLLEKFEETHDENAKKVIYLDIQRLSKEAEYQNSLVKYERAQFIRRLIADLIVPALIFTAAVFLPMGLGIALVCTGLIIAAISKMLINKAAPKENPQELDKAETYAFDNEKYEAFKSKAKDQKSVAASLNRNGLFNSNECLLDVMSHTHLREEMVLVS